MSNLEELEVKAQPGRLSDVKQGVPGLDRARFLLQVGSVVIPRLPVGIMMRVVVTNASTARIRMSINRCESQFELLQPERTIWWAIMASQDNTIVRNATIVGTNVFSKFKTEGCQWSEDSFGWKLWDRAARGPCGIFTACNALDNTNTSSITLHLNLVAYT